MMPRSASYHEDLIQSLKEPLDAAMYIEVTIEEGESQMLRKALSNVLEAHGGVEKLSEQAKFHYEKLDKALSHSGCPELYSLANLLDELGFHLAVTVKSSDR